MAMPLRGARVFTATIAGCSCALAGISVSPPAAADTAAYLKHLADQGISTPGGDPEVKEWGWEVCALFAKGLPPERVIAQAVYNSGRGPQYGMSNDQANAIVRYAVADLCNDKR